MRKFTGYSLQFTVKLLFIVAFLLLTVNWTLSTAHAQAATLGLFPSTGTFNKGCSFALDVNVDTAGGKTNGIDVIINYDQTKLTATSLNPNTATYSEFPGNSIDDSLGRIIISGLTPVTSSFSGKGRLATINFVVKETTSAGLTQVNFDFDPADKAKTSDTNIPIIEGGTVVDILSSVVNGSYTIGEGACSQASTLPKTGGQGAIDATPSAEEKPIYKTLPPAGSEDLTVVLATVGSLMVILGVLGLALL